MFSILIFVRISLKRAGFKLFFRPRRRLLYAVALTWVFCERPRIAQGARRRTRMESNLSRVVCWLESVLPAGSLNERMVYRIGDIVSDFLVAIIDKYLSV